MSCGDAWAVIIFGLYAAACVSFIVYCGAQAFKPWVDSLELRRLKLEERQRKLDGNSSRDGS